MGAERGFQFHDVTGLEPLFAEQFGRDFEGGDVAHVVVEAGGVLDCSCTETAGPLGSFVATKGAERRSCWWDAAPWAEKPPPQSAANRMHHEIIGERETDVVTRRCVSIVASAGGLIEGLHLVEPFLISNFGLCLRSLPWVAFTA